MRVFEFKVKGTKTQYRAIDEAIRTAQFVQNKCLRYWMDNQNVSRADGYYVQFCIDQERCSDVKPSSNAIGLDVGLSHFYTDSNGQKLIILNI